MFIVPGLTRDGPAEAEATARPGRHCEFHRDVVAIHTHTEDIETGRVRLDLHFEGSASLFWCPSHHQP
jgi:hypothetical protein